MKGRLFLSLFLALSLLFGLTAALAASQYGGVFRVGLYSNVDSPDPHLARTTTHYAYCHTLTDTLIYYAPDNVLYPWLAKEWEIADDGLTYTFTLEEGVYFHNGEEFNAEAVKFNLDRILTDNFGTSASDLSAVEAVNVLDTYIVEVKLSNIDVELLYKLSLGSTGMVAPGAVKELGEDFSESPVGLGAFRLVSFIPDQHIILEAFEDYWKGRPNLDRVELRPIPEETTRVIELESGNLDFIFYAPPKDVDRLEAEGYNVMIRGMFNQHMLVFNVEGEKTSDLQLRKAINYAIDRDMIIDNAFYGFAVESKTGTAPNSWGYGEDLVGYTYDPTRAAEILDEAGWLMGHDGFRYKDGEKLHLRFPTGEAPNRVLITLILQEQLKNVGIDTTIETSETGTYYSNLRAGEFDISYWILIGGRPDPAGFTANVHSNAYWNVSQIKDPRIDELLDKGLAEVDQNKRKEHYVAFQDLLLEESYIAWIAHELTPNIAKPYVKELELSYNIVFKLHNTYLDK